MSTAPATTQGETMTATTAPATISKWDEEVATLREAAAALRRRTPDAFQAALADAFDTMADAGHGYRGKGRTALVNAARAYNEIPA